MLSHFLKITLIQSSTSEKKQDKTGKLIFGSVYSNWLYYIYIYKWIYAKGTLNQSFSPSVTYISLSHARTRWWTGALRWPEPLSAHWSAWILSGLLCFPTNSLIIMAREAGGRHVLDSDLHILCSPIKSAMDFLYCHSKMEKDDSQVRVAFKRGGGQQWMRRRSYSHSHERWFQLITHSDAAGKRGTPA